MLRLVCELFLSFVDEIEADIQFVPRHANIQHTTPKILS